MDSEKLDQKINSMRQRKEQTERKIEKFLREIKGLNQKLSVLEEEKKILYYRRLDKLLEQRNVSIYDVNLSELSENIARKGETNGTE